RLDPGFGPDRTGKVVLPIDPDRRGEMGVALAPDGKLVLAGAAGPGSGAVGNPIIPPGADGRLHDHLRGGGLLRSKFGDVSSYATGVVVAPDGKVLAGVRRCDGNGTCPGVLARFRDDGALDPSFGTGGFAPAIPNASIYDLYVAHDGTITIGGYGNLLG